MPKQINTAAQLARAYRAAGAGDAARMDGQLDKRALELRESVDRDLAEARSRMEAVQCRAADARRQAREGFAAAAGAGFPGVWRQPDGVKIWLESLDHEVAVSAPKLTVPGCEFPNPQATAGVEALSMFQSLK